MNVWSAVRYCRELLRGEGKLVLVNRDYLRAVVLAAEGSPRFKRDRLLAKTSAPPTPEPSQ